MEEKEEKLCKAPSDDGEGSCGDVVLSKGMCSKHYQRVWRHKSTKKLPPGGNPKSKIRKRVEEEVNNYHGKDAFYDISNKLESEGLNRKKVRAALWHVLRDDKRRVKSG